MESIADLIAAGKEFGIFQFYLPFMLTFIIFYGILRKAKIFGERNNIDLFVSLIGALFIIAYTPAGFALTSFLSGLFGGTLIVVMTILAALMVLFMLVPLLTGKGLEAAKPGKALAVLIIIAIGIAIAVFISSGGAALFPGITLPGATVPSIPISLPALPSVSTTDIAIILLVVVTGVAVWFLLRGEGGGESAPHIPRRR